MPPAVCSPWPSVNRRSTPWPVPRAARMPHSGYRKPPPWPMIRGFRLEGLKHGTACPLGGGRNRTRRPSLAGHGSRPNRAQGTGPQRAQSARPPPGSVAQPRPPRAIFSERAGEPTAGEVRRACTASIRRQLPAPRRSEAKIICKIRTEAQLPCVPAGSPPPWRPDRHSPRIASPKLNRRWARWADPAPGGPRAPGG